MKHSVAAASDLLGTPLVAEVNSARQQYLPGASVVPLAAAVTVAASETIGTVVAFVTVIPAAAPICVPVAQVSLIVATLQRKNLRLPDQLEMPSTVRFAESLTDTLPAEPIDRPAAGMLAPAPSFGVVTRVVSHLPKLPRTKSFSVAVVEVDERVSDATLAKHSPARPRVDRLTPPS